MQEITERTLAIVVTERTIVSCRADPVQTGWSDVSRRPEANGRPVYRGRLETDETRGVAHSAHLASFLASVGRYVVFMAAAYTTVMTWGVLPGDHAPLWALIPMFLAYRFIGQTVLRFCVGLVQPDPATASIPISRFSLPVTNKNANPPSARLASRGALAQKNAAGYRRLR